MEPDGVSATSGIVAVITGANSGLGFETARELAARDPANTVILACRDPEKAEEAGRLIVAATGNTGVRAMQLDLSSMGSVRDFAARCRTELHAPIDALVCNAGIARGSAPTVDGLDRVFATNHLGHFLLALSLFNRMSPTARVISVSSDMHQPPGRKLSWPGADALAQPGGSSVPGRLRYSYSKLCNLYFVYELSRRLRADGSGVSVAAFNPGLMTETNFATMPGPVGGILKRVFASRVGSLDTSSTALAHLAAGPSDAGDADTVTAIDGHYFDRSARAGARSSELSYDSENARELWRVSARLTGIGT